MKMIFRLFYVVIGFALGIYVGVHFPRQAATIDRQRAQKQAQVQAAISRATAEVLKGSPGSMPSTKASDNRESLFDTTKLLDELRQAQQTLNQLQGQSGKSK